jgi:hypothetical protein
MTDVTLHLKTEGQRACVVCGADLHQRVSRWWLANCWTADASHYRRQPSMRPGGDLVNPCGALPTEPRKTPNGPGELPASGGSARPGG